MMDNEPEVESPDKTRIAIIGAGAAGLTAAYQLRKQGYRRIVVFDRRPRVGGKCRTERIAGRDFELGALVVGVPYDNIRELIRAAGLRTAPLDPVRVVDLAISTWTVPSWLDHLSSLPVAGRLTTAYLKHRHRLSRPGYAGLEDTDLAGLTFTEWLHDHRIDPMRNAIAPYYVGWGYGYLEKVAAVYVFKVLDLYFRSLGRSLMQPFGNHTMRCIPDGYQRLWERIAGPFELRLGADIQAVTRHRNVTIHTAAAAESFDRLILACPFPAAAGFLDLRPEESDLFSRIRTLEFITVTCAVKNLPAFPLAFVGNNLIPSRPGRVVSWYRRFPDSPMTVFYLIGNRDLSDNRVAGRVRGDLRRIGASVSEFYHCDRWSYFPHVEPTEIAAGYYRRFEALQGRHRTWYTGELLSFPTVENVAAYSRWMVGKYF